MSYTVASKSPPYPVPEVPDYPLAVAPPRIDHVTYAPFSDEAIQNSIDNLRKDSKTMRTYAYTQGTRPKNMYAPEVPLDSTTFTREMQGLVVKYEDNLSRDITLFGLTKKLNERADALEDYLKDSKRQGRYLQRSDPNGELIVKRIPVNYPLCHAAPTHAPTSAAPLCHAAYGGRARRRTRSNKKSHKKSRRVKNRHR